MEIKNLLIKNYGAIEDIKLDFKPGVPTLIVGPNGSGKTTVTKALDFVVNGTPMQEAVKRGNKEAIVTATIDNDTVIERKVQSSPYKTTCSIMGRKITGAGIAALTEEEAGLTKDVLKTAFRRDMMEWLNGGKFTSFFLRHDANSIRVVEMLNIAETDSSTKHNKVCGISEELPVDFKAAFSDLFEKLDANLAEIENAHDKANEKKKVINRDLKAVQAKCKGFKDTVKPEMSEKEINDKIAEILMVEKNIDKQKELRSLYVKALKNQQEWKKNCDAIEAEMNMIPDFPDSEEKIEALNEKLSMLSKTVVSEKTSLATITNNAKALKSAIDNISHPVCALNKEIKCTTDMTPYIKNLSDDLSRCEAEKTRLTSEIDKIEDDIRMTKFDLNTLVDQKQKTQKKLMLKKQLETLQMTPIIVPEEPKIPLKSDYTEEKKSLHELQLQVRNYNEMELNYKESLKLKRQSDVLSYCEELLDKNGLIVTEYAKKTVSLMTSACRPNLMNPEYKVNFVAQDGIKPYFNFGHGLYAYENLSTGEQILAKALITDLFSQYFNSSVMILDELNDLDNEHFDELMKFIFAIRDSYQNIILAMVNNDSLMDAIGCSYASSVQLIDMSASSTAA